MSLDGYIAAPDGDIRFLDAMAVEGEDYGYKSFYERCDTLIYGRKTYDKIISFGIPWPHAGKRTFVFTRQELESTREVVFIQEPLAPFISRLKEEPGEIIYCDGGGEMVRALLQEKLVDELIVSVIPVLLGEGISLFPPSFPTQALQLKKHQAFSSGLVQLHYAVDKHNAG